MPSSGMNEGGDEMATDQVDAFPKRRSKKAGPFHKVKAGSAVVPIYRGLHQRLGRRRFFGVSVKLVNYGFHPHWVMMRRR